MSRTGGGGGCTAALVSSSIIIIFMLMCVSQRIVPSFAQNFRRCVPGISCVPIRSCPEMVQLVRSGNPDSIGEVRRAICGFRSRQSLVCCPSSRGGTTSASPFVIGNRDSLLPRLCGRPTADDKIVGGSPAPIGAYPWMVAMGYTEPGVNGFSFACSGSIINSKYVLTAAHCLDPKQTGRKRLAVLHLGDWNLETDDDCQITRRGTICSPPHIVAGYEEVILHPQYDKRGKSSDDIALIRLNRTLDFENDKANIEPVCLPESRINVRTLVGDLRPVAAGWGLTEHGNHSDVMLRVDVPLADDALCRERFNQDFVGNQLCVGGEGGFDTCSGDSGGPLIVAKRFGPPFTQIGIVSFGSFPCGLQRYPGVYTSVSDYKDWIIKNIRP